VALAEGGVSGVADSGSIRGPGVPSPIAVRDPTLVAAAHIGSDTKHALCDAYVAALPSARERRPDLAWGRWDTSALAHVGAVAPAAGVLPWPALIQRLLLSCPVEPKPFHPRVKKGPL